MRVRNDIANSSVVLCLVTESFFQSARCRAQTEEARILQKRVGVLLKKGTIIPDGFFDGIETLEIIEWEDKETLADAISELMERLSPENNEIPCQIVS
jgi:hypothetical protein